MSLFHISGFIINDKTRQGIAALRVEAWDRDLICNDLVGSAVTDSRGAFQITFDESYFRDVFLDRQPDLFFKVFRESKLLKSTEDAVLWNVTAAKDPIVIEIKETKNVDITSEMLANQAIRSSVASNVVRVSIPAEVYFDLDKFQSVQKDILGRLGCRGCTSGFDIRFDYLRQFVVDENLNVKAVEVQF
jgi:hypothetical protein